MKKIQLYVTQLLIIFAFQQTHLKAVDLNNNLISKLIGIIKLDNDRPLLLMPIGPSGSGKSTLYEKIQSIYPNMQIFSLDNLRTQWYPATDYNESWEASAKDHTFYPRARDIFSKMADAQSDIYLDATNLDPSKRNFFIKKAQAHGYIIIGIVFNVSLQTLLARQSQRKNKTIKEDVIKSHIASLIPPQIGEGFDFAVFLNNA